MATPRKTPPPPLPEEETTNQNIAGYWWYYELDTTTAVGENVSVLFNNGSVQTADLSVPKSGASAWFWDGENKSALVESTRSDCPDKGIGADGKLGIYVFAPETITNMNIWAWDPEETGTNFTGGEWPGLAMSTDAEIVVEMVSVQLSFKVTGLTEGDVLFINGNAWNWDEWPFVSWGSAEKAATAVGKTERFATADDTGSTLFGPYTVEVAKGTETSHEVKVVQVVGDDSAAYEVGEINFSTNGSYTIAPEQDTGYTVTIDVSEGSYACTVAEN